MNLAKRIGKEKELLKKAITEIEKDIRKTGIGDSGEETAMLGILNWVENHIKQKVKELIDEFCYGEELEVNMVCRKEPKCINCQKIEKIFGKELL